MKYLFKWLTACTFILLPVFSGAAVINITSPPYNATTASADNAAAIQAAITAAASGDTVLVPAGTFLCGPITLKSNLNFQVAAGAILRMTDFGVFPQNTNFIYGKNLVNISITGSGIIDGQGKKWWDDFNAGNPDNRPPAMIYLSGCVGVTLTGVAVQDSPKFHIQLLGSMSKVWASGLSITAAWPSPNTDGIDLRGKNILIENCYISGGDDVIQLGGSSDPVSDVVIRNCSFGTGHGLSIGGYTQAGVKNVLVDNCVFNGTQYGIRWKTGRDRGGIIDNLTYSNITMNGILLYPFFLTSFYPNPSSLPPTTDNYVTPTATTPYWSNIKLLNITASTATSGAKSPGKFWAADEAPITNLLLDNVVVTGPSGVNFEIHHAVGVTITCSCRIDGKQPPLNLGAFDAAVYYPACGTATNTHTRTATAAMTNTPTYTTTRTYTATTTNTPSNTSTNTPAPSFTTTPSFTMTATSSATRTITKTATTTVTLSPVNTATQSPVNSPTAYISPVNTPTITWTVIIPSPTLTNSAVPVISDTATAVLTSTQTTFQTPVLTSTFTKVPSQTNTAVNTAIPSMTQTKTFTQLPTATSTATQPPESTITATATADWGNSFELTNIILYPNPYPYLGADLNVKIEISQPAEKIKARIYTVSFRRVYELDYGPSDNKVTTVTIPAEKLSKLASGTYYLVITSTSKTGIKAVSKLAVLIVIK